MNEYETKTVCITDDVFSALMHEQKHVNNLTLYLFYKFMAEGHKTDIIYTSTYALSEILGCSKDTIRKLKKELIEMGYIKEIIERDNKKRIKRYLVQLL